jgi:hypothetical protein
VEFATKSNVYLKKFTSHLNERVEAEDEERNKKSHDSFLAVAASFINKRMSFNHR